MKPTPTSPDPFTLLAFGAHPDDIEFGAGGIIARETAAGNSAHFVVCSRGESASNGTPVERVREAQESTKILGATVEFVELDGDAHLECRAVHSIKLAEIIRRHRPAVILAPTLVENQHPDHARLGQLVRDAARLARYGGVKELSSLPAHSIGQLFFYAITTDAEPKDATAILIDISEASIMAKWKAAMEAHASQAASRNYVEMQITRARLNGLRAGVEYAMALFPNDPIVVDSIMHLSRGARRF